MTLSWLFPRQADRRLLPGGRFTGPTPWVIAIMTFAMVIVAAAGLALSNAASVVARGVEGRYVVEVPSGSGKLDKALATVRAFPRVTRAEAVPEHEMRQTLERWLGPSAATADLPIPELINFDVRGNHVGALAQRLERVVPGARISAHAESVGPLLRSMHTLQWLSLALVVLMALATSATVVLAARGALDTNRSTIDVMHGIGATDLQVTHLFQRKIALDAILGGLAGGLLAGAALMMLSAGSAAFSGDLAGVPPLGARDVVILALLPALIGVLATWVARSAVLNSLRRSI
ncbi:MAG: cell division protein FtsX [Sphingomicrobium sp.]